VQREHEKGLITLERLGEIPPYNLGVIDGNTQRGTHQSHDQT
jgi:hypothetical protein